jgi:hypothetical protein
MRGETKIKILRLESNNFPSLTSINSAGIIRNMPESLAREDVTPKMKARGMFSFFRKYKYPIDRKRNKLSV